MFTGIITDLGRVKAIDGGGDTRFVIETRYPMAEIALGASIACSGPLVATLSGANVSIGAPSARVPWRATGPPSCP